VTRRVEEATNPIQGVRSLTSSSFEGIASVFIEFELGIDPLDAQQDVRAKVDQIRDELPDDIETPLVLRFDRRNSRSFRSRCVRTPARCVN